MTLKNRGAVSAADLAAIESAAELNPAILDAAAERAFAASDSQSFAVHASPQQLRDSRLDLLNRAKLQAIRSEVVPVQPTLRAKLQPALAQTASPALAAVALPIELDVAIAAALKDRTLVVRPLCPPGVKAAVVAGKETCIEGDAWSEKLFGLSCQSW